jgi:GT2 family glycosyltransferase
VNTLSVSIVSHFSDRAALARTLGSLARAVDRARTTRALSDVQVTLIDNSLSPAESVALRALLNVEVASLLNAKLVTALENRGYGAANNLAIRETRCDFHLVLNPDVELEPDCLIQCVEAMRARPDVVLITPRASNGDGRSQHVAKAMPGVLTLLGRALPRLPAALRDKLGNARYELRETLREEAVQGKFLAGGCFMFCRTEALRAVDGFDEAFFMYFEDFDLSLRLAQRGAVLYEPAARIHHEGGHAAGKGVRHIAWFARSAARFMQRHGWRWVS